MAHRNRFEETLLMLTGVVEGIGVESIGTAATVAELDDEIVFLQDDLGELKVDVNEALDNLEDRVDWHEDRLEWLASQLAEMRKLCAE